MATLSELIGLLKEALSDRANRGRLAKEFETQLDETPTAKRGGAAWPVLRDLRLDLALYVPDHVRRSEDPVYFGDDRFEFEVRSALERIRRLEGLGQ
jgi:hypothetical protein